MVEICLVSFALLPFLLCEAPPQPFILCLHRYTGGRASLWLSIFSIGRNLLACCGEKTTVESHSYKKLVAPKILLNLKELFQLHLQNSIPS